MSRIQVVTIAVGAAFLGVALGWALAAVAHLRTGGDALRLHALTKASQVEGAVSALSLLDRGDMAGLKQELEVQITSGLTKLHAYSGKVDGTDALLVREAIQKGEEYVAKHGLKVVRPDPTR